MRHSPLASAPRYVIVMNHDEAKKAAEQYDPIMWARAGEFPGLQDRIIAIARTPGHEAARQLDAIGGLLGDGMSDVEWRGWREQPLLG